MSDLDLDIRDMLEHDIDPRRIAQILEVPVDLVYNVVIAKEEGELEFD